MIVPKYSIGDVVITKDETLSIYEQYTVVGSYMYEGEDIRSPWMYKFIDEEGLDFDLDEKSILGKVEDIQWEEEAKEVEDVAFGPCFGNYEFNEKEFEERLKKRIAEKKVALNTTTKQEFNKKSAEHINKLISEGINNMEVCKELLSKKQIKNNKQ